MVPVESASTAPTGTSPSAYAARAHSSAARIAKESLSSLELIPTSGAAAAVRGGTSFQTIAGGGAILGGPSANVGHLEGSARTASLDQTAAIHHLCRTPQQRVDSAVSGI